MVRAPSVTRTHSSRGSMFPILEAPAPIRCGRLTGKTSRGATSLRRDVAAIPEPALSLASDRRRRGREVLAWCSSICSEFVQNPCDERVRAVPHRLERPAEGGSDLLTGLARDEMPQN